MLDTATREELIGRISALSENSTAQWGRMTVYQMLKHCTLWEEMALGKRKYKRWWIGRIFGRMVLKTMMKDDSPLRHNTPTVPEFIVRENGDITAQKLQWIARIREYEQLTDSGFIHPFFGKVTAEQMGRMAYKHSDHHLRQFNG